MNAIEIRHELDSFTGTTTYHKHLFPGLSPLLITDGCNYIREVCNAYWLFDAILSYQVQLKKKGVNFQVWQLVQLQKNLNWQLTCRADSNLPPIITQDIEYSDFPLDEIKIWVIDGVALLPKEY